MVVMPSVYNSAYTDMKYGLDYFSYLTEELTDFVERNFPAATKRENRFIAGMSMGGYGAYKWGLTCPENLRQSEALRDLIMRNIVIRERLTRYPPFVKRYMVIRLRLHRRFMMFYTVEKPERRRKRYSEIVYLLRYRGQTSPGFGRSEGVCGSAGRSAAV